MRTVWKPQPGPQTAFARTSADIAIYGGAAGGGKTVGLLLDSARGAVQEGNAVIFRRTSPQITAGGGLWDAAAKIYPGCGAKPYVAAKEWRWSSGKVQMRHLQYESDVFSWDGAELPHIGFDELIHFTRRQFFYLHSRNRGGRWNYLRATTNPDANSWVANFLEWWIDQETGYPIPERSGAIRWFYRQGDDIFWYGSKREAQQAHADLAAEGPPTSCTFIPAKLSDNAIFCARDPSYRSKLLSQSHVDRARLLDGNWKITAADGMFRAEWFGIASEPPSKFIRMVRAWDFAATESDKNDPDWTVGILMGLDSQKRVWVLDVQHVRYSPEKVRQLYIDTAKKDGESVHVVIEQEPGSAGKIVADIFRRDLPGFRVSIDKPDARSGDKVARASPHSAAAERGEVMLLAAPWNKRFIAEHVEFPYGAHDDLVDGTGSAYRKLTGVSGVILF